MQMGCLDHPRSAQEKLDFSAAGAGQRLCTATAAPGDAAAPVPAALQSGAVSLPDIFCQGLSRHPDPTADRQFLAAYGDRYIAVSREYFRQGNFLHLGERKSGCWRAWTARGRCSLSAGRSGEALPLLRALHLLAMFRLCHGASLPGDRPTFPSGRCSSARRGRIRAGRRRRRWKAFADLVDEAAGISIFPPPAPSAFVPGGASFPGTAGARDAGGAGGEEPLRGFRPVSRRSSPSTGSRSAISP